MVNRRSITEEMRNLQIPDDIQNLVNGIISGIMSLAAQAANSNRDSRLNIYEKGGVSATLLRP